MEKLMNTKRKILYFNYAMLTLNNLLNKINHVIHVKKLILLRFSANTVITSLARTALRRRGHSLVSQSLKIRQASCSEE